jgi:hypothetical protein
VEGCGAETDLMTQSLEDFEAALIGEEVAGVLPQDELEGSLGRRDLGLTVLFPQSRDDLSEGIHGSIVSGTGSAGRGSERRTA